MSFDTDILIIGAGMSGIGLAVQLRKKYPQATYDIIEKSDNIGGTWWANTYPGCGCDVPSHFYSYSFALNPDWSRKFSLQPEIAAYFRSIAEQHDVPRHITYLSAVEKAEYEDASGVWVVTIRDQKTGTLRTRRCKVLVSAVGALSVPKKCDINGASNFRGKLFHSAQWDHTFDYAGKDVVVVGNGCSATQFVPVMSSSLGSVKKITQFSRQAHWLAERPNPIYSSFFKFTMRYVPLAMRAYRGYQYYMMESDFAGFDVKTGGGIREDLKKTQTEYIKKTAPEKYHKALIPKTEIGCKRKVMDTDYLACLHGDNVELDSHDPIAEIVETGVLTKSGRHVHADAIVLATGFETQQMLFPMEISGEGGLSLQDHWDTVSSGAPQAYYGTMISHFPNFFTLMGANTTTGHLSVIYSVECQINFILRLLHPILTSLHPKPSFPGWSRSIPTKDLVAVKPEAEERDNIWLQSAARNLVWATGCTSWYVDEKTGRNTMMYPDWQWRFWLRSIFIPMGDFVYKSTGQKEGVEEKKKRRALRPVVAIGLGTAVAALGSVRVMALQNGSASGGREDFVRMVREWIGAVRLQ